MIQRTTVRMRLCIAMLCVNIMFIWGNSLLPGEISGAFSQHLLDFLVKLFSIPTQSPSGGHGLLRKLAHFGEFCCLGLLLSWLLRMLREKDWTHFAIPLSAGIAVACIDETIQHFVPDRGPGLRDVLIDTLGVCTGIILIWAFLLLRQKKKQKMKKQESN